jgi:hypothetical protein
VSLAPRVSSWAAGEPDDGTKVQSSHRVAAKGGKKRVERDSKGVSKMSKLEGIYSKAEDVFEEIKGGDMGPSAK